jgi:hypothetical protein
MPATGEFHDQGDAKLHSDRPSGRRVVGLGNTREILSNLIPFLTLFESQWIIKIKNLVMFWAALPFSKPDR